MQRLSGAAALPYSMKHARFIHALLSGILLLSIWSCRKGERSGGNAPETKIAIEAINLEGENRLRSQVRLSWFGSDIDGYITGYEISLDNQNWAFTDQQDSTFLFDLPAGQVTADIDFYVRAIDNDGLTDPTPAYLKVPIQNTAPEARFINDRGPKDTAFCAATFFWTANDEDGNQTISKIELRFNNGDWFEVSKNQSLLSFLLDTSATGSNASAALYYGTQNEAQNISVNGLNANGNNTLYIRATDIAGATSAVDTATSFYFKNKTPGVSLLWVNGHAQSIGLQYKAYLDGANLSYDALNYGINQGARQPFYWNPTFRLTLSLYKKVFINASPAEYTNPVSGQTNTLLRFMAPTIQSFTTAGGKVFASTSFTKNEDVSTLAGPFPIESAIYSVGQARISNDSALVAPAAYPNLPDLKPQNVQFGVVPIVRSADAVALYRGQLSKLSGWTGDNLMAAGRVQSSTGKLSEVFIAAELHNYDANGTAVTDLIEEILKNEF
jgi:hypothetical protein